MENNQQLDTLKAFDLAQLKEVIGLLKERRQTISTAESCTAGLVSYQLTMFPGSSNYFLGGISVYSNDVKHKILGVSSDLLDKFGAVSEEVAAAMSFNCRSLFSTDYALSLTGIAGPDGGTAEKPVGTVWCGLSSIDRQFTKRFSIDGSRNEVRGKAASLALVLLKDFILRR
ncbi:MAG: nicotinamide-nucleotide amidohydrolase family protein [Bdellovibrionota bacterium]